MNTKQNLLKLFNVYYVILFATPLSYALRMYGGYWLERKIYLKQHGSMDGFFVCMLLPPPLPDFFLLTVVIKIFLWAKKAKARVFHANQLSSSNYFEPLFIGLMVCFLGIIDVVLLRVSIDLAIEYLKA